MCKTDLTREIFNPLASPSPTARFGIFHTVREDVNNPISLNLHFGKDIFSFAHLGDGKTLGLLTNVPLRRLPLPF